MWINDVIKMYMQRRMRPYAEGSRTCGKIRRNAPVALHNCKGRSRGASAFSRRTGLSRGMVSTGRHRGFSSFLLAPPAPGEAVHACRSTYSRRAAVARRIWRGGLSRRKEKNTAKARWVGKIFRPELSAGFRRAVVGARRRCVCFLSPSGTWQGKNDVPVGQIPI